MTAKLPLSDAAAAKLALSILAAVPDSDTRHCGGCLNLECSGITPPSQGSLADDILTVCKAFDDGLFVRSIQNDSDDAWQLKFIGPLGALSRLLRYAEGSPE